MSLVLLQGYSSAEEDEEEQAESHSQLSTSSDDETDKPNVSRFGSVLASSHPRSGLPSAFEAFSQVSGPPQFLNNFVEEPSSNAPRDSAAFRGRRKSKDRKDAPPGAIVQAKAQLVGIHDRVRTDIGDSAQRSSSDQTQKDLSATAPESGGKKVSSASNPDAKDASELLRMCLQCGIPKTYSNARGMVCPECGDRPSLDDDDLKKKGSAIKDKEKVKRMRGQSSHATWKSETEMQLRQQFD